MAGLSQTCHPLGCVGLGGSMDSDKHASGALRAPRAIHPPNQPNQTTKLNQPVEAGCLRHPLRHSTSLVPQNRWSVLRGYRVHALAAQFFWFGESVKNYVPIKLMTRIEWFTRRRSEQRLRGERLQSIRSAHFFFLAISVKAIKELISSDLDSSSKHQKKLPERSGIRVRIFRHAWGRSFGTRRVRRASLRASDFEILFFWKKFLWFRTLLKATS